jgi:hypothetical protein
LGRAAAKPHGEKYMGVISGPWEIAGKSIFSLPTVARASAP